MQAYTQLLFNFVRKNTLNLLVWVLPLLIVQITACSSPTVNQTPQPTASPTTAANPPASAENVPSSTSLKLAFIINTDAQENAEQQRVLTEYLSNSLQQPVTLEGVNDYNQAVELLVEEKVQVVRLGPLTYIEAKQRNPLIEPIVAAINEDTNRPWYQSAIVVNTNSGIQTLDDLRGKRIGFVSQLSTSGYMFAAVHLLEQGFDLENDFATVEYLKSHSKTLAALLEGQVDVAVIQLEAYNQAKAEGKIPDNYQVIWESEPIPESPIVVSQKLPSELITALKDAFISSPVGMVGPDGLPSNGYTLVQDSDYERVRQVKQQLEEKLGTTP